MKVFSFFYVLMFFCSFAVCEERRSEILYGYDKGPSQPLLNILNTFEVCHDGSWDSIVLVTQEKWRFPKDKERWMFDIEKDDNPKLTYLLFSAINMTNTFWAKKFHYDYGLVVGATVQAIRRRIDFVKQEWERGVRFDKLFFLTGDRKLDSEIENNQTMLLQEHSDYPFRADWEFDGNFPETEMQMIKLVFEQMQLPEDLRKIPVIFINASASHGELRPTSKDTIDYFLKENEKPGDALVFSSQPYIGMHDTITRYKLPDFCVEVIGPGVSFERYISSPRGKVILFDQLARWIYEEITL